MFIICGLAFKEGNFVIYFEPMSCPNDDSDLCHVRSSFRVSSRSVDERAKLNCQAPRLYAVGKPNRILYGVDSFGMTCGSKNTIFNATFDLSNAKNLYWLK